MADANMLQGILRWSLAQSDGAGIGDAKPMTEEDRKFLEAAMSQIVDETKRMKVDIAALNMRYPPESSQPSNDELLTAQRQINRIIECIKSPTKYKFEEESEDSQQSTELLDTPAVQQAIFDAQLAGLEELEDRVLSMDNSIDAVTLGILPAFIDLLTSQPNNQTHQQALNLRWRICSVLATITQNNSRCQQSANNAGMIDVLLKMVRSLDRFNPSTSQSNANSDEVESLTSKVIVKALYSLASMCRECEPNSNLLVDNGGVEMVVMVLDSLNKNQQLPLTAQMATKSLSLIRTLISTNTTALEIAEKCNVWTSAASFIGHDDVNLRDECMRTIAALVRYSHHSPPAAVRQRILDRIQAVAASTEQDYHLICENEMNSAEQALKSPQEVHDNTEAESAPVSSAPVLSLAAPSS